MARKPQVQAAQPWRFPPVDETVLPNGLQVSTVNLPGQRVVTMTLLLDVPLTAEPRQTEGVAALAMQACDEGTLPHPGSELVDALEGCGAVTQDAGAGLDGSTITIEAPASRLAQALPLLAEMVAEPAYDEADIQRLVESRLLVIATGLVSPPVQASKALRAWLLPTHRVGRLLSGDTETVATITRDDVVAWHQRVAQPVRARLVLAGELPSDVNDLVHGAFGSWSPGKMSMPEAEPWPPVATGKVVVVDHPDAAQVSLRIGTVTPGRTSSDWPALQVANATVGAMFGSRLNRVLREERGLTYGAGSGLTSLRDAAFFTMQAECRPEVAAEATSLALQLLDLSAAPVTPDEARDAIAYITGATPLHLATADAIAAQVTSFALCNLPPTWFDEYTAAARRVTAEDATEAFARHIQPTSLVVALCGPAELLLADLARHGIDAKVEGRNDQDNRRSWTDAGV
ncbi:MAG: insulinase family protein [Propionibacteriaceae bacterium]|nr:insulinase family protein [Propionibacteriaceae bacterium]